MIIVDHRRNTTELLRLTPNNYGIEIDIRSSNNTLIVHHDPFEEGIALEDLLREYNHSLLILNVKEEGLEDRVLKLIQNFSIESFFFLDQSFPFLLKTALSGEPRCAIRFSEYESIQTALNLKGKIEWVWVDTFTKLPIDKLQYHELKAAGFKLCLVSPELQGHSLQVLADIKTQLTANELSFDAVCTKHPDFWDVLNS